MPLGGFSASQGATCHFTSHTFLYIIQSALVGDHSEESEYSLNGMSFQLPWLKPN